MCTLPLSDLGKNKWAPSCLTFSLLIDDVLGKSSLISSHDVLVILFSHKSCSHHIPTIKKTKINN